ncbi:hypothetical protein WKR88_05010 [Trinickia caryophylli]|uniref:Uncharacterized protein n=1 Tax=Trinickia caryophylli TaxID=28094 RepID=A0A1X7FJ05_TRICW|nr:hypothetical protein [Trinickia caryophylli]PMS13204.1 hypothetical protein C0Z17_05245 [Trinickia caryophylli]TRX19270.1 hypothetical protein FNF07_14240 [Trinickia caryophylli]WQE13426.1 hypothetical protein U0034_08705 [Trinickia caryophylli]SMF53027.1 hypothetical protein SAMN06295900_10990 [Trinickia caryophylli]GLU34050.1 hypothetical protein Busp01_38920 [Trinickia caryophylli]
MLCLPVLVAACAPAHYVTTEAPHYDPTVSARVRILTGNDLQNASIRPGTCYTAWWDTDPDRIDVDDGYFSRFKYSSRSVTIGMPPSPRPRMRTDGLVRKDMIREYVVDAGKPLAVLMGTGGGGTSVSWSCTAKAGFTPVPGQDYDIYLFVQPTGRHSHECAVVIRRIDDKGLDEPVEGHYIPACSASSSVSKNSASR